MTGGTILHGRRFRAAGSIPVAAELLAPLADDRWRASITPADLIAPGDRLRFGEPSESTVCLLSFLDADVVSMSGETAVLAFAFCGPALTEALDRLRHAADD